jgi:hypothetical protein
LPPKRFAPALQKVAAFGFCSDRNTANLHPETANALCVTITRSAMAISVRAGDIRLGTILRLVRVAMVIGMLVLCDFPEIATWLPDAVMGKQK